MNTTSTADISFMLLIFFLVTSSMGTDKGLLRQLPPPTPPQETPTDIRKDHVLTIVLDAHDQLTCDGAVLSPRQLTDQVVAFVSNDPQEHVLSIQTNRETTYEAYFHMQNAIAAAYGRLREDYARKHYAAGYASLDEGQRHEVNQYYPQRISEQKPEAKGGIGR